VADLAAPLGASGCDIAMRHPQSNSAWAGRGVAPHLLGGLVYKK
jgi:hypothetical protein